MAKPKLMTVEEAAQRLAARVDEVDTVEAHDAGTKVRTTDGVEYLLVDHGDNVVELMIFSGIPNYSGPLKRFGAALDDEADTAEEAAPADAAPAQ